MNQQLLYLNQLKQMTEIYQFMVKLCWLKAITDELAGEHGCSTAGCAGCTGVVKEENANETEEPQACAKEKSASGVQKVDSNPHLKKPTCKSLSHLEKPEVSTIVASAVIKGRMYDFNSGRFLSVDPFIQGTTSQAINPYSYMGNNPLSGTDPTGYIANSLDGGCGITDNRCGKGKHPLTALTDSYKAEMGLNNPNRFQMQSSGKEDMPEGNVALGEMTVADIGSQNLLAQTDHNIIKQRMRERCEALGNVNCDSYRNEYDVIQEDVSSNLEKPVAVADALTTPQLEDFVPVVGPLVKINKVREATKAGTRITNVSKADSKVWKGFESANRKGLKTTGKGKDKRYFEWDHTHNDIEVYNKLGDHLGSMHPETGEIYKAAVAGRNIRKKL